MKEIPIKTGGFVIVDDDVAEWLADKSVHLSANRYPAVGKKYLHRLVADTPLNAHTDHINRNTMDCRRENLRVCSHKNNLRNIAKKKGANPFKGVFLHHTGKWRAQIMVNRKTIHLGVFKKAEDAAAAYDEAAKKYFREFAAINAA